MKKEKHKQRQPFHKQAKSVIEENSEKEAER